MLTDFLPPCPRIHPGMMVQDDSQSYDHEWVCRSCGTRLYGKGPESAVPARITFENPRKEENMGRSERRRIQNQNATRRYRAGHNG
jgi:hypothetical protein